MKRPTACKGDVMTGDDISKFGYPKDENFTHPLNHQDSRKNRKMITYNAKAWHECRGRLQTGRRDGTSGGQEAKSKQLV